MIASYIWRLPQTRRGCERQIETSIEAGGVWFLALADGGCMVSDDLFIGTCSGNAMSFITWTVTNVQ